MKEFRERELLSILNKQYSGMHLKEPRKVEKNSVVLLRNIANESKREPMRFARVLKINESKDNAQRILTLTYNNIKKRKDGNWTGIPTTVERSINDVIPIDNAVNESMLSPSILEKEIANDTDETDEKVSTKDDGKTNEDDEIILDDISGDEKPIGNMLGNEEGTEINTVEGKKDYDGKEITREKEESNKQTRRSERIRKQRVEIHPDDIGDNDNENYKSYKQ